MRESSGEAGRAAALVRALILAGRGSRTANGSARSICCGSFRGLHRLAGRAPSRRWPCEQAKPRRSCRAVEGRGGAGAAGAAGRRSGPSAAYLKNAVDTRLVRQLGGGRVRCEGQARCHREHARFSTGPRRAEDRGAAGGGAAQRAGAERQVDARGSGSGLSSPRSSLAAYCLPSSASTARSAREQGTRGGGGGGHRPGQPQGAGRGAAAARRLHLRRPKAQQRIVCGRPAGHRARPCRSQMLPKDPFPMRRPSRYLLGYVEDDEAAAAGAGGEGNKIRGLARQRLAPGTATIAGRAPAPPPRPPAAGRTP